MASLSLARKVWHFATDYWWVALLFVAAVASFFIFRKWRPDQDDPFRLVKSELAVIQAGAEVRNMAIELGVDQARAHVKDKYRAKLEALETEQQAKAAALEEDPVALAKYLEGISR